MLAALLTHRVVQWLAVAVFAVSFALVVAFADPIRQVYAYPVMALASVAGFAAVVRRQLAPVVLAVAFVLAVLPTAGVADRFGRDIGDVTFGSCTAPVAAFFVDSKGSGWTEYTPLQPPIGETRLIPQVVVSNPPDAWSCDRLAGQRLATSLGGVLVGVLLVLTTSRGPAADFRVRGLR